MEQELFNRIKKYIIIGSIIIFSLILIFGSIYTVQAGERGVLLTFGKASPVAIGEGLNFKFPLVQKVVKMDVKTQKYEAELTAASKDLQDVRTKMAINYRVSPELTPEIYTKIGIGYADKIIYPLEQEINKYTTAQFTAEELVTKREEVRETMKQALAERLAPRGIIVEEVSIIDFAFSESFSQAIEAKVTAEQLKLKAATDLERINLEAEAIKLQRLQLSAEYLRFKELEIQKMALEKWDGHLPQVTGGAIPFIDITKT